MTKAATKRIETAAERNRRIAQENTLGQLETVTCSCGCEWQCIKRDLTFWFDSGVMPTDLAGKVVELQQKNGKFNPDHVGQISPDLLIRGIEFSSKVVRMTVVEPKIVEFPREGENEVGYDEVMQCCYATIKNWQLPGGGKAESLESFPTE